MSEKPSDDDKIPPDSEPKDIIWWSSETNRTVEGYLKQRDNIQREIDNIKKDYGITTEIMIKVHIPKEYLKKDKNGNTYISAKKRIDTFKSCPYGMIISTELTDFTVNLVEHNYTINQKEIQEDKMAAAMMADSDIQDILNRLKYKSLDTYKTDDKVYI